MCRNLLLWSALVILASGCTTTTKVTQREIKPRASFDLDCPEKELNVNLVEGGAQDGTYGADGCGKQVRYDAECSPFGTNCLVSAQPADVQPPDGGD